MLPKKVAVVMRPVSQLVGTGWGIFGLWIKWLLLSIITLGIYTFWVYPRLMQWKVEKNLLRVGRNGPASRGVQGFSLC
ncbi:uncharacterized membrane protein YjgN (DUF898 family) [Arthrobacter pascens]|nr:uncharacterized membrane protein YjgN (DUF898 family) [Arthrobacter pascens]